MILSPGAGIHSSLEIIGMVFAFGTLADAINTGLYAAEGDFRAAGTAALAAVPIVGEIRAMKSAVANRKVSVLGTYKNDLAETYHEYAKRIGARRFYLPGSRFDAMVNKAKKSMETTNITTNCI